MDIYFAKVPDEYLTDWPEEEYFLYNDNYYYLKAEIDEDGLKIIDTCNRYMPIDRNQTEELAMVVFAANQTYRADKEVEELKRKRQKEMEMYLRLNGFGIDE